MSMISAQIDGLRERAKELRQGRWSDGADDARLMEDAADTIWQLRDDLQRANDAARDAEHDESCAWDRVRKAEAEADRLREERDMYRDLVGCMVHPDIPDQLAAENAKLREQMERLVTLLRVDCDIDANWDGLRRFWSIGLTEGGCLMRDRACEAEAENAKLRELCSELLRMAESNDPDFLHWPEIHDELQKLGVKVDG